MKKHVVNEGQSLVLHIRTKPGDTQTVIIEHVIMETMGDVIEMAAHMSENIFKIFVRTPEETDYEITEDAADEWIDRQNEDIHSRMSVPDFVSESTAWDNVCFDLNNGYGG